MKSTALSVGASAVTSIIVAVLHYVIFRLASRLAGFYEEVDAEMPVVTRFLVENPLYFWIVPLLVAGVMLAHQYGHLSRFSALIISWVGAGVSTLVCAAAIFLAISQLGSVVAPP